MAIRDQVILITGGARGIGLETGKALAARGARLALTDLDAPALADAVAAIGADRCEGIVADVCDLAAMEAAVATTLERFGRIDTVLANAGIASYGSVLAIDPATFQRTIDINIVGVFNTARASVPALAESRGYLLVVSSLAAFAAAPGLAAYNASKAGVEHLANALRLEVAHQGIAVGAAHMSWIDTPLVQDAKSDLPTFRELLSRLPPPLNRTTGVEACVRAFVKGVDKRSRHVYCPGWVRGAGLNRNVINSAAGNRPILKLVPDLLPRMDAEFVPSGGRPVPATSPTRSAGPAATGRGTEPQRRVAISADASAATST